MNTNKNTQSRITTKQIQFIQNKIAFTVDVTYTNDNKTPRYWGAKVIKPKGVETARVEQWGINGVRLASKMRQVLEQDDSLVDNACEYSIYDSIVNTVYYTYFNKDEIAKYRRKVKVFNQKIDNKYKDEADSLLKSKRESKRKLKAGEITDNDYQNVKQKNDDFTYKISALKKAFHSRYFGGCSLKKIYRRPDYQSGSNLSNETFIMRQDKTREIIISERVRTPY